MVDLKDYFVKSVASYVDQGDFISNILDRPKKKKVLSFAYNEMMRLAKGYYRNVSPSAEYLDECVDSFLQSRTARRYRIKEDDVRSWKAKYSKTADENIQRKKDHDEKIGTLQGYIDTTYDKAIDLLFQSIGVPDDIAAAYRKPEVIIRSEKEAKIRENAKPRLGRRRDPMDNFFVNSGIRTELRIQGLNVEYCSLVGEKRIVLGPLADKDILEASNGNMMTQILLSAEISHSIANTWQQVRGATIDPSVQEYFDWLGQMITIQSYADISPRLDTIAGYASDYKKWTKTKDTSFMPYQEDFEDDIKSNGEPIHYRGVYIFHKLYKKAGSLDALAKQTGEALSDPGVDFTDYKRFLKTFHQ